MSMTKWPVAHYRAIIGMRLNRPEYVTGFIRLTVFLSLISSVLMLCVGCASKQTSKNEALPVTGMTGRSQQFQAQTDAYQQLTKQLQKEVKAGQTQVTQLEKSLKITFVNEILFPGGGWNMDRKGKGILDKIIPVLKTLKGSDIEVYGHTDNSPVISSLRTKFSTNRELSLARAVDVVNYLKEKGISPDLLTATGYGADQPAFPNDTPQGRAKNRRTEILIMDKGE
jgi:chemotaxis protein MotB